MEKIKLALVGIGKIARDQHLPALAANKDFDLIATASRNNSIDGITAYKNVGELLDALPELNAISLSTPPEGRFEQAMTAIRAGKDVMLEKPPAATVSEAEMLIAAARAHNVVLFATWHSREAAEIDAARAWLKDKVIKAVRIRWMEDIRQWHPGQDWILAPGGFGVFDPGINALSIATTILPEPLTVLSADMGVPSNRACPLTADIRMRSGDADVDVKFNFLQTGTQTWDIEVDTDAGMLRLGMGGSILEIPGEAQKSAADEEYARLYKRFAELVRTRQIDVDLRPLHLVADSFMIANRTTLEPFEF